MHCIVAVLHEKDLNVDSYFERFLYSNTNMYELEEEMSFEDANENIKKEIERLEALDNIGEWESEYLDNLKNKDTALQTYADYYDFTLEEDRLAKYSNLYGECDYFSIGGRFSDAFQNLDGVKATTMRVQDINLEESFFQVVYAVVNEYIGGDYFESTGDGEDGKRLFQTHVEEAIKYSEIHEVEIYMTIVDAHY